jgi:hypothetical protein
MTGVIDKLAPGFIGLFPSITEIIATVFKSGPMAFKDKESRNFMIDLPTLASLVLSRTISSMSPYSSDVYLEE